MSSMDRCLCRFGGCCCVRVRLCEQPVGGKERCVQVGPLLLWHVTPVAAHRNRDASARIQWWDGGSIWLA